MIPAARMAVGLWRLKAEPILPEWYMRVLALFVSSILRRSGEIMSPGQSDWPERFCKERINFQ